LIQPEGKLAIPGQLLFHALDHAADRAFVEDFKLLADFL
jgi:hypothetical protein